MLKKLLVAVFGIALTFGVSVSGALAVAGHGYFGHISEFVDESETGEFYVVLTECEGDTLRFEFEDSSDKGVWRSSINAYIADGHIVNIEDDGEFKVETMANVAGAHCENLDAVLSALEESDEEDNEGNMEEIFEIYRNAPDDMPDGYTLAEPPSDFEDDVEEEDTNEMPRMKRRGMGGMGEMHDDMDRTTRKIMRTFKIKSKADISDEMLEQMDGHMRGALRNEIRNALGEGRNLDRKTLMELKEYMGKRSHMEKRDERVEELEDRVGFKHVNPMQVNVPRGANDGDRAVLRGIYKSKDGVHVLVNADGEMFVKLDLQGKDFSEFLGQRVFVKGKGYRNAKLLTVESMRALNQNESELNNPEMQFRIGASLYNDIDSNNPELWYAKYLGELYDKGVFTGYEDGSFGGANPVTVSEIAKVVAESAEHQVDMRSDMDLKEKYRKHWGKFYLKHAEDFNLLPEIDNPDRPATRKEVIEAILRAYGVDPFEDDSLPDAFPDTDDEFIRKAFKLKIVGGFPDGEFRPDAPTNRAEMAKMMTEAMGKLGDLDDETSELVDDLFEEVEGLSKEELEDWVNEEVER